MDEDPIFQRERYLMEQIRELDEEELQIEEVETLSDDSSADDAAANGHANGRNDSMGELTFNTSLASLHTYLGEVEDTHHRMAFVDSGTILTAPLFFLEGVVLFPEATLPLRIIQTNFIMALERAMSQVDSPNSIGVVRVYRDFESRRLRFASVGTTAEIRQYRRLEDGSVNVVTRGKQRFHVRRHWIDVDGAPCGEIEIIEDDVPLRTPRDAFGTLPLLSNLGSRSFCHFTKPHSHAKRHRDRGENNDSEADSEESFLTELSLSEMRLHQSAVESCCGNHMIDGSMNSDDEKYVCELESPSGKSQSSDASSQAKLQGTVYSNIEAGRKDKIRQSSQEGDPGKRRRMLVQLNQFRAVPRAFWPYWVYRMFDSFTLAQKAVGVRSSVDIHLPGLVTSMPALKEQ